MTDSELDPHVLISCRVAQNPKIVDLPSDRARWGWVVLMGAAKLQRPPGRFASDRVVAAVLGEHRRFLPDYLRVGVLEPMESLCDHCAQSIPPEARNLGALAVHDWATNQSRTTRWRKSRGVPSGHENLSGDDGEMSGETTGKHPHAGARAMQSQSHRETTNENEAVEGGPGGGNAYMPDGDRDALDTYHELTGYRPWGEFSGAALKGAIRDYSDATTDATIRAEHAKDGDRNTLLKRTLAALARNADRRQRTAPPPSTRKPIDEKARMDALRVLVGGGETS
jgi:hypothetical protein